MCWNKQVSLITFVFAIIGVVYLYKRNAPNDRWIALFGATIAMIQLAEFFMWSDQTCGTINKYASMFALLILALEPLSNMIGGLYFGNNYGTRKTVLRVMLVSYILFIGYLFFTQVYGKQKQWCGTSMCGIDGNSFFGNKGCNLRWLFLDEFNHRAGIIWILFLMLPILTMTPTYQGIIFFALGFTTFVTARYSNVAATGSIWCWLSIVLIYVKIFIG